MWSMRAHRDKALFDVHPQPLRAPGERDRKNLAEPTDGRVTEARARIGRIVERALTLMDSTKQDAAYRMGYADQGIVSRWCTGVERPQFDKLLALDGFEHAWLLALAEQSSLVRLENVIRFDGRKTVNA